MFARFAQFTLIAIGVLLVGGVITPRLIDEEKSTQRIFRIAVAQYSSVDLETMEGFKKGMAELGYAEGRTIVYLHRPPAGTPEKTEQNLRELIAEKPDLLMVSGSVTATLARDLTAGSGIPVVFAPVNDPISAGIVANLREPGGNITGVRLSDGEDLRMQFLVRAVPTVRKVFLPYNPNDPSALSSLADATRAAELLKVRLVAQPILDFTSLGRIVAELPKDIDAVFMPRDSSVSARFADIFKATRQRNMPLCAPGIAPVRAGALISYGFVHFEVGHQAAHLADQILRGTPPALLPVETSRNYLSVNLTTAQALGLPLPDELLRQSNYQFR